MDKIVNHSPGIAVVCLVVLSGGDERVLRMRQALYRKYRPKTLSEVVGQEYAKIALGNQLASGQIGHAYLFTGPKGTGKTSVARILARTVNCLELKDGEACGKCSMCQAFDNNQMMDLIEIDAASNRSIDSIRELISKINLAPSQGKYKIYVIDEAHQLTKDASNALLKTLEEPPAHAIFVLATTEPDKLLPTIISRCQRFDFRYVPMDAAIKFLGEIAKKEKIKISPDGLEFVARQSAGGMRDAMSLLEQASFIEGEITQATLTEWLGFVDWNTVAGLTKAVMAQDAKTAIAKIDELYHDGYDLGRLTAMWVTMVRQILAVKLGNEDKLALTKEQISVLKAVADVLTVQKIIIMLQELMLAGKEMKFAAVPQAPLEVAVVKLAYQVEETRGANVSPPAVEKIVKTEPTEQKAPTTTAQISLAELQEIWPKVLGRMRSFSPTLAAMLSGAQVGMNEGAVTIKFASKFHKEKMEQTNSMGLLSRALQEIGFDSKIVCALEENQNNKPIDLQNISEVFGGIL